MNKIRFDWKNNFILTLVAGIILLLADKYMLRPDIQPQIEQIGANNYKFQITNENPWIAAEEVPIQIASGPVVQLNTSITEGTEHVVSSYYNDINNSIVYIFNLPPGASVEGNIATSDTVAPRIKQLGRK